MTTTTPGARPRAARAATPRRGLRAGAALGGAALVLALALLAGVWVGALPLPPGAVVATLLDRLLSPLGGSVPGELEGTQAAVLLELRLPRVLIASLVGAGLAVSGAAYQGVFRNPLADPYLLGVAAGAGFGATLAIAYGGGGGSRLLPLAAFAGASLAVAAAYALGRSVGGTAALLLAGVTVAAFLTAAQTFVQQQNADTLQQVYSWILGRLT